MKIPGFNAEVSLDKSSGFAAEATHNADIALDTVVPAGDWCCTCTGGYGRAPMWRAQYRASDGIKAFFKCFMRCGDTGFSLTARTCNPRYGGPVYRCYGWNLGKGNCNLLY